MPRNPHEHVVQTINPAKLQPDLLRSSEQIGHLMTEVQRYYLDMGLVFVDTDPPAGSLENNEWRMGKLAGSGPINEGGSQFTVARCVEANGKLSRLLDGICGLVILSKKDAEGNLNPCLGEHTPLELVEFDVRESQRGMGLGKEMLRFALKAAHPEDKMVLDFVECNDPARAMYERWGFRYAPEDPFTHGIFATTEGQSVHNIPMESTVGDLQSHLGMR